ncbi:hypothetical protein HAHE_02370 [Haloferula helveola]|uniref:Haem-binding domain-containing protein n=2 Tax=Haloferula helveola TaxID=490095 RepID=A0ABN6H1U3_9BACT|nr:hypothetical protein HAHE_02370 [Haloferula helveola]
MTLPVLAEQALKMPQDIEYLLEDYCFTCHEDGTEKGDVRLDNLGELSLEARLDMLNRAHEQVFLSQMPPPDKKSQPTDEERAKLMAWISGELDAHGAGKLEEKLRYPAYGNAIDHDALFSGEVEEAAYTPARRWLVSPQIFNERVLDVFELEGRDRMRPLYGVTNPFLLPDNSGVRYYDNGILDGGHLLVMLKNADWISAKQIRAARVKKGEIKADEFPDQKDRWAPRSTPEAFETVILKDGAPNDAELEAAIRKQFQLVLRRDPTTEELSEYLDLARSAVELGGNTEGLRQMLVTVVLDSEFLYRLEFGAGEEDGHGRKKLSPREAAFAISYAIGDRGPDAELTAAAAEGRLETREDYRREVARLLEDPEYYRGEVDSSLDGKHYKSNETAHPKIIRFFREFFGYPASLRVFKDGARSEGKYSNPDRGTQGTPGWLTLEADRIVTWHVEKDRDVFKTLLTSDEFFVYHNMENEQGDQTISEWRSVYERLKDTPWRTEPQKVLDEHLEFLKTIKSMRIVDNSKPGEIVNYMLFFEEHFGKGITPFTRIPWSHGYYYHHAPFYSLPPTPSIWRYGSWKSSKVPELESEDFWDYPTHQPFRIANRKGILTHPAWLIAHSTNFHADAIRRGRWIREKLLAGRVPDVPITVDAQVPEDPHRTFRQRVEDVTADSACWKCHQHMNPLGFAFEMYDDFGRYRLEEIMEHPDNLLEKGNGKTTFDVYKTAPIVTTGELDGTGDPALDGEVEDAFEMIDRLAESDRVRQSIIRHAFRFYMGRNEKLSDSRTLIDADKAYLESDGSFKAVILSLLTSDSFIYRK